MRPTRVPRPPALVRPLGALLLLLSGLTTDADGGDSIVDDIAEDGPRLRLGDPLPPELQPWSAWVLARHPDLECPEVDGTTWCLWPGVLDLAVTTTGGTFSLDLRADREIGVPLPGDTRVWPQRVTLDGRPVPVYTAGGTPFLTVSAGEHRIQGGLAWTEMPPSLAVPPGVARVSLRVHGQAVPFPEFREGRVRLGSGDTPAKSAESLELDVVRRVQDGIPLTVTTRVVLRAAGRGREVDLGTPLLPRTRPTSLKANLPARFTPKGHLLVQVRPGTFELTFDAVHDGPVASLQAPSPPAPWPESETWAVVSDDRSRAVTLTGPAGVDPARTSLPQEWRSAAAFLVRAGETLAFQELRRGEPDPPPNALSLERELWLDQDGQGFTVRDSFTGTMDRDFRLDLPGPAELGHVVVNGTDQVITASKKGQNGVEVRQRAVAVTAESRLPERFGSLPAVGWTSDVQRLSARLHLPPGWTLLGATGVDHASQAWLERFTLLDLFFVVLAMLAVSRLHGWSWALVALFGLGLARHEADSPTWTWVTLLVTASLLRVVGSRPGWGTALRWLHGAVSLVLLLMLVPFATEQVKGGLFPVLTSAGLGTPIHSMSLDATVRQEQAPEDAGAAAPAPMEAPLATPAAPPPMDPSGPRGGDGWKDGGALKGKAAILEQALSGEGEDSRSGAKVTLGSGGYGLLRPERRQAAQQDNNAVVQTGPGVPAWTWRVHQLDWSGPVNAGHRMRLFLLGPGVMAVLMFGRAALLVALALRLAGAWRWPAGGRRVSAGGSGASPVAPVALGAAVGVLVAAGLAAWPRSAAASPGTELLQELETRLTRPPACGDDCAAVPTLSLTVRNDHLEVRAQVDAAARVTWPVPGPAETWIPSSVTVGGREARSLARLDDGLIHLRLDPGVHQVVASGPLPAADSVTLQFGLQPRRVLYQGVGWTLDGLHADGTAEGSVQLTRTAPTGGDGALAAAGSLTPWIKVHRELDLGIPWLVHTRVERIGPADNPVAVKVPLLAGESVNNEDLKVEAGAVLVTLGRDGREVQWDSTLPQTDRLALKASSEGAFTEDWSLLCSPIFQCRQESGIAPLEHVSDGRWRPSWSPWPGEEVALAMARPAAAPGQSVTVEQVGLRLVPGSRLLEGELTFTLRASRSGQRDITLPRGAELRSVVVNGLSRPIKAVKDKVSIPVQPGRSEVSLDWQQPHAPSPWDRMPAVHLGGPAVNVRVQVEAPEERFVWLLSGPSWGPVPLYWTWLVVVLAAAALLGRVPGTPLSTRSWALLGLGMTQLPVPAVAVVAGWFLALAWRQRRPLANPSGFNLTQLAFVGWTGAAGACLYFAVYAGLLVQPDMQVEGNGSTATRLHWYVDRIEGALPQPVLGTLPLWTFRVAMLAWALWLAWSLTRWLPWAWNAFSTGGRWKSLPRRPAPPPPVPRSTPDPEAEATGPAS